MHTNDQKLFSRKSLISGMIIGASLLALWTWALTLAPSEKHQGEIYRIIYLHVPSAFAAFASSAVLLFYSISGIRTRKPEVLHWQKACAEVGLIFTAITLATGSIWGKPTWGTWWTWDARLTTTFLLALLYAAWLLLHASLNRGPGRVATCSVLGILIFADVPIIYKSVTWWRTLHQPQSILRPGGSTVSEDILGLLIFGIIVTCATGMWLLFQRAYNLKLKDELESSSFGE